MRSTTFGLQYLPHEQYIQDINNVDGLQLPDKVVNDIHKAVNARWHELTTGPGKSVYVFTFFLDPCGFIILNACYHVTSLIIPFLAGYVKSPIFKKKNMNPIATCITIPTCPNPNHPVHIRTGSISTHPAPDPHDVHLWETMPSYIVVGKYLLGILTEIRANTTPDVFDNYNDTSAIVAEFCHQFAAYTCQEMPFIYTPRIEPDKYWKKLISNKDASVLTVWLLYPCENLLLTNQFLQVLALKLFSMVLNSMVEEHTISNFTKLKSTNHVNQKASTIVNTTKVKQHMQ